MNTSLTNMVSCLQYIKMHKSNISFALCLTAADCTNVDAPTNGARSPEMNTISSGSDVTLTCNMGFTLVGGATTTCTDGALSPIITDTTCGKIIGGRVRSTGFLRY